MYSVVCWGFWVVVVDFVFVDFFGIVSILVVKNGDSDCVCVWGVEIFVYIEVLIKIKNYVIVSKMFFNIILNYYFNGIICREISEVIDD